MAGLYWHLNRFDETNFFKTKNSSILESYNIKPSDILNYLAIFNRYIHSYKIGTHFLRQFSNNICKHGQWAAPCYMNLFPLCFLVIVLQSSPCNIARLAGACDLCEHSGHLKSGSDFFELLREWWKTKHACELWLCPN